MGYWANLYAFVSMYFLLGMALGFFSSRTGYISLLHAGFFGLGAYVNAVLLLRYGVPPVAGWALAAALGGVLAYSISLPIFRTRDDYFAILTIALQLAFSAFLTNADGLTNGPLGLAAIPAWPFSLGPAGNVIIFTLISALALALFWALGRSVWATSLAGVRDDETLMLSLGYDVPALKAGAFAFSAAVCSFVGALYAQYVSYIDPTAFQLGDSILILTIAILAGMGGVWTLLLSSAFVIGLPEVFRFLPISSSISANIKEIVYAVVLILIILARQSRSPSVSRQMSLRRSAGGA